MPKVRMNDGTIIDVPVENLLADDGQNPFVNPQTPPPPTGRVFSEEDVARIREEEKNKLYGRIDDLGNQVKELTNQIGGLTADEQRRKAELEAEQQRLQEEARRQEESELDAKSLIERRTQEWQQTLAEKEQSWEQKLAQVEAEREAERALREKERAFNDLREYAQGAVEANKEKIAPQLFSTINGNSKEEIDAAVQRAIQITDEITADFQNDVQQLLAQQQPGVQFGQQVIPQPQQQVPVPVGVTPYAGPSNFDPAGAASQQLTAQDINNMDMTKYAELRRQIGIGGTGNNRGLFG